MSDENYEPSKAFYDAASFASKSPQMKTVSNNVKLELYALYKMVTVSRNPRGSRPSIFDMTGRAKWDAWAAESKASNASNQPTEEIENRYIALCTKYGWVPSSKGQDEGNSSEAGTSTAGQYTTLEESVDDIDWDAPYDPAEDKYRHGGKGMGNKVSVLQEEDDGDQMESTTIHGLAVLGDAEKLKTLLDLDVEADVNEKDEYGYTALHLAADRGHPSIARLLLQRGADVSILDADGFSALELAEASGKEEVVQVLKQE
ncbi:hypothetical protein M408DRAFT_329139 [Serendipita vermifera MAFF 305830]|uniref:ACB domain-containing protein n=1 Tax=Serendipita vermifera MAFF 305830 TaxID=933852 RepID=A0A0C3AX87_SERVB|nr:hypothetical protein M408DRAFT_329139 [Serendipita vermifera MAFF 305830]